MAVEFIDITIDFTAAVAGCHRCGFRKVGDPTYDTSTEVICAGVGPCTILVTSTINTTSCDGIVDFEGYIQPCCEDVTSLAERTAWGVTYTPTVACDRVEITMDDATVTGITIKDPGYLYEIVNPLVITRQPGDLYVIDAVANIATIGDGVMGATLPAISSPGLGYTSGDILDVIQVPVTTGTTAQYRVIGAVGGGGEVLTIALITAGSEYYDEGTFTFSGGTGAGVDLDIVSIQNNGLQYNRYGAILTTAVTVNGQYSIQPIMTITTGSGLNGDLSADTHSPTTPIWATAVNDCTAGAITITNLTLADTPFAICCDPLAPTPPVGSGYIVTPGGCCINADTTTTACTTVDIENTTIAGITIDITECGGEVSAVTIPALTTNTYCLVLNGYNLRNQRGLTVTDTLVSCP